MSRSLPRRTRVVCAITLLLSLCGCGEKVGVDRPLNPDLARSSLEKALNAWVEGKRPADLKPDIIMGDFAWEAGKTTLVAFEILKDKESSDGSNLYIPVMREFKTAQGKTSKSETTYIVGTSPVITIFPQ